MYQPSGVAINIYKRSANSGGKRAVQETSIK